MKKIILFALLSCFYVLYGQIPMQYYSAAHNKSGYELKTALSEIITSGHVSVTYSSLWTHFQTTDRLPDGTVWDMYSDCTFTFGTNQCGNYKDICDCYNREHSFPVSWFGGSNTHPMYTDLFHLYPTDGKVNAIRANYPFGETNGTQHNISKLGASSFPGYTGIVFEPADEYKGDFARTYFYVATRYESQIAQWSCPMLAGNGTSVFTKWAADLLLKWHLQDPVSEKERNRIEVVYGIQKNRNPFIDYPELAELIWGDDFGEPFSPKVSIDEKNHDKNPVSVVPNPICHYTTVSFEKPFTGVIHFYNVMGVLVRQIHLQSTHTQHIDLSTLPSGLYILKLAAENQPPRHQKIIKY
ncbi:MAG: endonuclease [Bacteroidales bacterium]|nr:endonuclease [Bacteroidales bacterium]